jgi:hypothetical protein
MGEKTPYLQSVGLVTGAIRAIKITLGTHHTYYRGRAKINYNQSN